MARDLPSLREVWGDNAVYFRDANGLTKQVQQFAADPDLLRTMGERAQKRAATFTVERMADAYLALFAKLGPKAGGEHVS